MAWFQRIGCSILVCSVGVFAWHPLGAATVNQSESWEDGQSRGWRLLNQATGTYADERLTVSDGYLEWSYEEDGGNELFSVTADADASDGWFYGDYFDVGVMTVRLEFYSSHPTELEVELWHETELLSYAAKVEVSEGWQTVEIPLDMEHFKPWPGTPAPDDFRRLIEQVGRVWIGAEKSAGVEKHTLRIRDVRLAGAGPGYADWIRQFDGEFVDQLPVVDWNGDGATNAEEYVADTTPNETGDRLTLDIAEPDGKLSWESSSRRSYVLWRSSNLKKGFTDKVAVFDGTGGTMEYTDPAPPEHGDAFYRLQVLLPDP